MHALQDWLLQQFGLDPPDYDLRAALEASSDGRTIVGEGFYAPSGGPLQRIGWRSASRARDGAARRVRPDRRGRVAAPVTLTAAATVKPGPGPSDADRVAPRDPHRPDLARRARRGLASRRGSHGAVTDRSNSPRDSRMRRADAAPPSDFPRRARRARSSGGRGGAARRGLPRADDGGGAADTPARGPARRRRPRCSRHRRPGARGAARARRPRGAGRAAPRPGFASERASAVVASGESSQPRSRPSSGLRVSLSGDATLGRDYLVAIEEGGRRSGSPRSRSSRSRCSRSSRTGRGASRWPRSAPPRHTSGPPRSRHSSVCRSPTIARLPGSAAVRNRHRLLPAVVARVREAARNRGPRIRSARRCAHDPGDRDSASAVAVACALMGFARFGLFRDTGPALAIGAAVALARSSRSRPS